MRNGSMLEIHSTEPCFCATVMQPSNESGILILLQYIYCSSLGTGMSSFIFQVILSRICGEKKTGGSIRSYAIDLCF